MTWKNVLQLNMGYVEFVAVNSWLWQILMRYCQGRYTFITLFGQHTHNTQGNVLHFEHTVLVDFLIVVEITKMFIFLVCGFADWILMLCNRYKSTETKINQINITCNDLHGTLYHLSRNDLERWNYLLLK